MPKQILLIDPFYLPISIKNADAYTKYDELQKIYKSGKRYILLNNTNLFGPYSQPKIPWDISEEEKIVIYQQDVAQVNKWLLNEIFSKSALFNYRTLNVLIRIATGMLNKCNISKDLQIMFHDNMVKNLTAEHHKIMLSGLPF